MGTWGMGHFDSDTAADFTGSLDDAPPGKREALIEEALTSAARTGAEEYLDAYDGVVAVAAAALLAAQMPGGAPVDSVYGPDDPLPPLDPKLRGLAVRALDRVVADESELLELWADVNQDEQWSAGVRSLRASLAGPGGQEAG
ncbi:DUF4259 domain-containing protein [Streptomyces flavovirens]|uniref:DUF4259 domain-containing protein n=1 Tax=Streptomyces TaxID=1883 RepID=UPI001371E4AA|nr:DUF4259 domain-containing protein [Streptomyces sp. SID3915]MYX73203.1 DUF4259 domain-containing protein [Streptomyces sp. SID3915]